MNETTNTKPYEFRTLGAEDIFPMVTILGKIGIKEFKTLFEGDGLKGIMSNFISDSKKSKDNLDESDIASLGASVFFELAGVIICNLPKAEKDIFNLLANVAQMDVADVRKMGLADFTEMIIDFFKKDEFKDFMKVVSKFFK